MPPKAKHEKIKDLKCDHCDYKTGLKSGLRHHIKNKHGGKGDAQNNPDFTELQCPKCEYSTPLWSNMSVHVATFHEKMKIFSCDSCNYGTHRSGDFKKHVRAVHEKIRDFSCGHCDYKSSKKSDLDDHIQTHHSMNRELACDQCPYKAKSSLKMAKHMSVHRKIWKCDQCSFKTGRRESMLRHSMAVHDDFTALQCQQCDFNAPNPKVLKRHIKGVHKLSNRMQKCPLCKFETNRGPSGIELHMKSRHYKIKDLACPFCDFRATYRQKLQKHVKMAHPETDYLPTGLEYRDDKAALQEILNMPQMPMEECFDVAIKTEVKKEDDEKALEKGEENPQDSAKVGEISRRSRVFKYRNPFFKEHRTQQEES